MACYVRRKVRLFAGGSVLKFVRSQTEGFYDEMFFPES